MKACSDTDDVVVRAPLPEPVLDTNTMSNHKTEEKQHNHRNFAIVKFLNDLNHLRSIFFPWKLSQFCASVELRIGKCKEKSLLEVHV